MNYSVQSEKNYYFTGQFHFDDSLFKFQVAQMIVKLILKSLKQNTLYKTLGEVFKILNHGFL
jgi:hypothetical protein